MKERAPYYLQASIERKRASKAVGMVKDVSRLRYRTMLEACSYCGRHCSVNEELGTIQCKHRVCHLICQGCLVSIGGVYQQGKDDVGISDSEDCPCHKQLAEKLMGKNIRRICE
jgi:hypothetical protein